MLLLSALDPKFQTVHKTHPPQMKEKYSNQQVKTRVTRTLTL